MNKVLDCFVIGLINPDRPWFFNAQGDPVKMVAKATRFGTYEEDDCMAGLGLCPEPGTPDGDLTMSTETSNPQRGTTEGPPDVMPEATRTTLTTTSRSRPDGSSEETGLTNASDDPLLGPQEHCDHDYRQVRAELEESK